MEEKLLDQRLTAVERQLENVGAKLDQLNTTVLSIKLCSAPDSCLTLQSATKDHEERIRSIEKWQNTIIGVGTVIVMLSSVFGPKVASYIFK